MFTRLSIRNFRSLGDVTLELGAFTVIVGQNQAGKSNVLRAMRALFTNQTGDDCIRQGHNVCTVALETQEGFTVVWEKTKGSASYTIKQEGKDDRLFTKLAGQVPVEVQDVLGIRGIEVDATTIIWPQIHRQGESAFLIKPHLSSGQAARAIARLTKLDIVVKAQQLCKAAIRELTSSIKEDKNAIVRSISELEEFQHLEEERSFLASSLTERGRIITAAQRYEAGSNAQFRLEMAEAEWLRELPDQIVLEKLRIELGRIALGQAAIDMLEQIQLLPAIPDTADLDALTDRLVEGASLTDKIWDAEDLLRKSTIGLKVVDEERREVDKELDSIKGQECPVCGGTL